jgi:hypothetical protein
MRWLVQENLNSYRNYIDMLDTLTTLNVEFLVISMQKDGKLTVIDTETKIPLIDSSTLISNFTVGYPVMVYGSKGFADAAVTMELKPGSFMTDNFDFKILKEKFGTHLLNYDFLTGDLFSLVPPWQEFFIRPTGNNKLFTGTKITLKDFTAWQEREFMESARYHGKSLMASPLQIILSEYRFFVVKGNVVAHSSYMVNGVFDSSGVLQTDMLSYLYEVIKLFTVADAYVIDIASTPDGFKIVEFNNLNSSGFYSCDISSIVQAINKSF